MKLTLALLVASVSSSLAAYSGDIVQYWVDQSAILANGTVIGGLASPPSGWFEAIVQGAVYLAAIKAADVSEDLAFHQLAVSHAAHDTLTWTFHGTRLYPVIDQKIAAVLPAINLTGPVAENAIAIGRKAARKVIIARADDGINYYEPWKPLQSQPGQYNSTPGGQPIPDTPQARYLRLFGGVGDVAQFRSPAPPAATSEGYDRHVLEVKEYGSFNGSKRTPYDTETAYYWRESSPIGWNRFAHLVVGNSLATDVVASAKFYAQLNYAIANAGIASWDIKYHYNAWRPITAIRRRDIWLASGQNISDPNWVPLLTPTPNHQDYVSTHATFGAGGAGVIAHWNGGDAVDIQLSSNVTVNQIGVITRRITSIAQAVTENGDSRVFGGIHFRYATEEGERVGYAVAKATLEAFDEHWDEF